MKIYILESHADHEGSSIEGVYSSKVRAESVKEKMLKEKEEEDKATREWLEFTDSEPDTRKWPPMPQAVHSFWDHLFITEHQVII